MTLLDRLVDSESIAMGTLQYSHRNTINLTIEDITLLVISFSFWTLWYHVAIINIPLHSTDTLILDQ
jgi:hypothetical protein